MKKITITIFALLLVILTACNSSEITEATNKHTVSENDSTEIINKYPVNENVEYSFYFVPSASGTSPTDISSKIPTNINDKNFSGGRKKLRADAEKAKSENVEIVVGKKSHKINYINTYAEELFCNDRFDTLSAYDEYEGDTCNIQVRRADNKLTFFFNRNLQKNTVSGDITEDRAKEIAKEEIVSLYGEAILEEYRQDNVIRTNNQLKNSYTVLYTKYVYGLRTLDDIEISINMQGEIIGINALYLGVFNNIEKELNKEHIDNALNAMNNGISNKWTLEAHTLTIDSEGDYYIRANGYFKGENGMEAITVYINVQ